MSLLHLKGLKTASVRSHPVQPGKLVYVAGASIIVADEADRQQQWFLSRHETHVSTFAVSGQGSFVASALAGQRPDVLLWSLSDGSLLARMSEHDHGVPSLTFSLDERLLLSVGNEKDRRVFLTDTSTGHIVSKGSFDWGKVITAAAFAPGSGELYTFATAMSGELVLWTLNPFTGLLSQRPVTAGSLRRSYTCLVFSADGQWLYGGTTTGDVVTINVLRAAVQLAHPACGNGVGAMVLSSTGLLLVGGGDGGITLFSNDHMWRDMRPFVSVPGAVTSLSTSPEGAYLVVGTADGSVWRVQSGSLSVAPIVQGPGGPCNGLATAPGAFATAAQDGRLHVYSLEDQALQQVVAADPAAGVPLCVSLGAGQVVSGWSDGAIRSQWLAPGPPQGTSTTQAGGKGAAWVLSGAHALAHSCGVTVVQVAPRGHLMVSGGAGGEVRVWNMVGRTLLGHLKPHTARINALTLLQDDVHLLAASDDRTLSATDINTQKTRGVWRRTMSVRGIAVCPDQMTLVTVGNERDITLWDIRVPDAIGTIYNAHDGPCITAVATSQNDWLCFTGGGDGVVKLWDLRAPMDPQGLPTPLFTGTSHTDTITGLAFHPDGCLMSCAADGCVATWRV